MCLPKLQITNQDKFNNMVTICLTKLRMSGLVLCNSGYNRFA